MYPVGITTCYGLPLSEETLFQLKAAGLDAIELSLKLDAEQDLSAIRKMADAANVRIWSCHLPFRPTDVLDISLESSLLRKNTVARFSDAICRCADIGVDKFVVHPSTPLPLDADRNERKKCSMDTLNQLAEVAHSCGAVIAVEDMTQRCLGNSAEELAEIISVNDKLRICFDVNHLCNNTHRDFVRQLGDKIVTVHISDYNGVEEKHWFPGEGTNDWHEIYHLLQSIGYNGVWLYELSLDGAKMVDRGRPLTFQDFRRNADEIFTGQPLTVITKE